MRGMGMVLAGVALVGATAAQGRVAESNDRGFTVHHEVQLVVPPAQAYAAFGDVARWWSKDHTYSGDAANLSLALTPGGCFCERMPGGGGIEHLRVALVRPGEEVVLTGALGPLLYEAVSGVMQVRFQKVAGGTKLSLDYRAAGFAKGGAGVLAPLVDQVLGEQVKRLRTLAGTRRPDGPDPLDKR